MKKMIIAGLLTLAIAGMASASATVKLTGSCDGTYWYVWAKDTGADQGIESLDLYVQNIDTTQAYSTAVLTPSYSYKTAGNHQALMGTYGFNNADGTPVVVDTNTVEMLFGQTITTEPPANQYNVRGFGIQSVTYTYVQNTDIGTKVTPFNGTISTYHDNTTMDPSLGIAPMWNPSLGLLMAIGVQLPGQTPSFLLASDKNGVLVWDGPGVADPVQVQVGEGSNGAFLPEPATMALLGLGGLMTLIRRRRHA